MDVLAEARAEAEQIREAARNEGYVSGSRRRGRLAGAGARRADAGDRRRPRVSRPRWRPSSSAARSSSGWRCRKKIVGVTLGLDPAKVVGAVEMALRGIVERDRITVLVNPDDLEIVREAMDGLRASLGGIDHCEVQAERRVGRGGCHRAHARGRHRRARGDQARARGRGRRRRARPLMISRCAADKTSVFSVMDAALDAVDADGRPALRGHAGDPRRGSAPADGPRRRPDRPDRRSHRPRGRGGRGVHDPDQPRPAEPCRPRWSASAPAGRS